MAVAIAIPRYRPTVLDSTTLRHVREQTSGLKNKERLCKLAEEEAAILALANKVSYENEEPCAESNTEEKVVTPLPTIAEIKAAVTEVTGVSAIELDSERKARDLSGVRQLAMYVAKRCTVLSLPKIGRGFGGRHHTTVMHAVSKIKALRIKGDQTVIRLLASVCSKLEVAVPPP